jgi:hypothetical protein
MPAKKTKIKYSRWLITVNPNRKPGTYPGGEQGLRSRLALCARLLQKNNIKPYLYIMKKGHSFEQNVLKVDVDSDIEKGARGFWHTHIYVSVTHTTSLRLSYPVLRAAFAKVLSVIKPHFDARLIKGGETLQQVREYVHKGRKKASGGGDEAELEGMPAS